MEGAEIENLHKVSIYLPVKIEYKVLEIYLQKKFLGKILSKGKANGATSDHAKIQKINLERSPLEDYDLSVYLQLQLLTTLFTNKEIKIVMHLSLGFKEAQQEVLITKFRLDGENEGWFTNRVVETFINSFMYAKIKEKMHFDLRPVISKRLEKLNLELSSGKEVVDGISLSGKVNEFRVQEIIPGQQTLLVSIKLLGNNVLNIKKIDL